MLLPYSLLLLVALASTATTTTTTTGGKFLFYMPMVSKSMEITFMPLAKELASRGHKVTIVMPFAQKKPIPNIEIITIASIFEELTSNISRNVLTEKPTTTTIPIFELLDISEQSNNLALSHPEMLKYIKDKNTKFDVVLVSTFILNEAGYYLSHRFGAHLALYLTIQVSFPNMDAALGQPHNPAYVPLMLLDSYRAPLTFVQRVINTVATFVFQHFVRDIYMLGRVNGILDQHFPGEVRPSLLDIERNASVAFTFGHPLIGDGLRPLAPNFQYLGMMNCKEPEPLPKDLQNFMDGAGKHGLIYVSFGSVLKASEMSAKTKTILLNVFKRLDQKILWKWETEEMEDKPGNVKLSKWLPQQDVLAHPNTKFFLTHGGQSSSQEALCHQKATLVVSVMGDQHANGREAERIGCGISLPFTEMTEEKLYNAIQKLLNDKSYAEKAKEHGSLLTDQIEKPLDRAVWWLEFLLRHPGKNHLRSPVHDLAWYQYFLLDVLAFLLAVTLLLLSLIYKLVACCCCRKKKKAEVVVKDKKKRS